MSNCCNSLEGIGKEWASVYNASLLLFWHPGIRPEYGPGQQMRLARSVTTTRRMLFCLKIPLHLKRILPPQRPMPEQVNCDLPYGASAYKENTLTLLNV